MKKIIKKIKSYLILSCISEDEWDIKLTEIFNSLLTFSHK